MKNTIVIALFLSVMICIVPSCKKKPIPTQREYVSIEALARELVSFIDSGNGKELSNMLIPEDVYKKEIFDFTALGRQGDISADDYFRIFLKDRRTYAVGKKIAEYRDYDVSYKGVGLPGKVLDCGSFKVLRRIPVHMTLKSKGKTSEVTDNDMLGAVIEKNGKYRLLNVFRD